MSTGEMTTRTIPPVFPNLNSLEHFKADIMTKLLPVLVIIKTNRVRQPCQTTTCQKSRVGMTGGWAAAVPDKGGRSEKG